ncbi:MAG: formylglycine-generating enzyme family protein [Myxococcota bacterium]
MYSRAAAASLAVCCGLLSSSASASDPATSATETAPERRDGRIVTVVHQPPDMVIVPAGTFTMGPSASELEDLRIACRVELGRADWFCARDAVGNFQLEARQVRLDAFAIDRHEVTAGQFRECVAAGRCDLAALVAGDNRYVRDEWPIVNVTWQDSVDYCSWLGKRLPTEAEWEKAARGTEAFRWPWGNHERRDGSNHGKGAPSAIQYTQAYVPPTGPVNYNYEFAPDDSDGYAYAAAPGALRWSESPYGTYDMAGNAAEWVQDYFGVAGYEGLPTSNPVRDVPDPRIRDIRVRRGGSWAEPKFIGRTYYRTPARVNERQPWVGFRCARDLD